MSVITPISNEPYYKLNLDNVQVDSKLIISTYQIIKSEAKSTNIIKKIINLVKSSNNIGVFDILINILDYSIWIRWFEDCNVLKYYWDDELLKRIIDTNKNKIYSKILLDYSKSNLFDNLKPHLICLTDSYVLNYNYTNKILAKRSEQLNLLIGELVENFILTDYFGCSNLILILGNNRIANNLIQITKTNTVITFYPNKQTTLKIKSGIDYCSTDDCVLFKMSNLIIKFSKYYWDESKVLTQTNGYINWNNLDNLDIQANAELYQKFNDNLLPNINIENTKKYQESMQIYLEQNITKADSNTWVKLSKNVQLQNLIKQHFPKCYDCKKIYDGYSLPNYPCYCLECGIKNFQYKNEKADLTGLTFFITGIRVKIGFATTLRLLRSGSNVIGTTRFPNFALYNYSKEPDYESFKSRLTIIYADFLVLDSVYKILDLLGEYKINGFINMAFRTIKPTDYYTDAVRELETEFKNKIFINNTYEQTPTQLTMFKPNSHMCFTDLSKVNTQELVCFKPRPEIFINQFGDVQDFAHSSSWTQSIDELDPKEIVECVALNQLVPTLIINKLKSKLIEPKFIINVGSYEGQFNTGKTDKHIHTNMCKSALNMLIRSLEEDPDPDLHVHTINPGYVSGVNPQKNIYPVNLDDSAAKITWPIFQNQLGKTLDKTWTKICNYEKDTW